LLILESRHLGISASVGRRSSSERKRMLALVGLSGKEASEKDASSSPTSLSSSGKAAPGLVVSGKSTSFNGHKTKEVEAWENQRYKVGVGFCADGLLPTDAFGAFSTKDGSDNFASLEEATEMLVTAGWDWVPGTSWLVDSTRTHGRNEGWVYAVNFYTDDYFYAKDPSNLHFVRRRCYVRRQVLRTTLPGLAAPFPPHICYWTQVYSQEAYKKWLNETAARERADKLKRENEALLANSGGHMMPVNVAYGAIEGFGRTLYTLPNAVVENAQKQVSVDWGWSSVALFLMRSTTLVV